MRQLKGIAVVALLALALVALSGCACDMIAKKATEDATGVKVDEKGNKVTVTGEDGNEVTASSDQGKLPDGLPDDVPAYEGTIKSSATMEGSEGANYSFSVETKDDATTVVDWYKDKLAEKGWKITSTVKSGDTAMIGAEHGDTSKLLINVGKDDSSGMTIVTVVDNVTK